MFKEKSSKKRIGGGESAKDVATLDARHQQVIQTLQEKQEQVAALEAEKSELEERITLWKEKINELKAAGEYDTPNYNDAWANNIALQERVREIRDTLKDIHSFQEEIQYYEDTGYILFQYYDLLRKQAEGVAPLTTTPLPPRNPTTKGRKKHVPVSTRSILDAFGCNSNATSSKDTVKTSITSNDNPILDKSKLVDEYLSCMDTNYLRPICQDALGLCMRCQTELVCLQQEGTMVCPSCGYQELLLVEQNRPLLRQVAKDASHQSYKRINHFREWCSQLQGRESTDIPEDVFEQILQEIKKEKITDHKKINYTKMREILKRLRLNKYYEHITFIIRRITDQSTPHFSPELEDKLCSMFKEIQTSFVKHCPPSRKNFLSYAYILFKFFQILGQQDPKYLEYCKHLSLLKSREKLYLQDQIFKKICEDLGWPVIPTL
jgi:chaperonin cofactor prefoldin/DNA-directed RNA polymerase subunit RPC12/RpoP